MEHRESERRDACFLTSFVENLFNKDVDESEIMVVFDGSGEGGTG